MKMMQLEGYTTIRTAGSHSAWDILFWKDGEPLHLAQLKYTKTGKVPKKDIEKFNTSPLPENSRAHFITYTKGTAKPEWAHVRTCGAPS